MDFVNLHVHSEWSFHAGIPSVAQIAWRAKSLGQPAVALTDRNRMSGLILFYKACKDVGITPILGVELSETDEAVENIVILAKTARGYGDLCEITSERNLNARFSFKDAFSKKWPDLLFLSNHPDALSLLARGPNRANLYAELVNNSETTRHRSLEVARIAQAMAVPLVATNDAYFLDESDWETHRILRSIGLCSTLSRLKTGEYASKKATLSSLDSMAGRFPRHPGAVAQTLRVARQCNAVLNLGHWIMPEVAVPCGETPETYLRKLAHRGLERNYAGTEQRQKAREIQEMELKIIGKLGYASYFLMVKDVRDWAGEQFQMPYRHPRNCTVLRGSAANSITFYNIGASDLDPIRYNLYFQRFLNEERASPPDADLDFGWDERDQVLEYVCEKWGRDRTAITCTANHFRRRSSFRETAKVFGYSDEQISKILKTRKRNGHQDPEIRDIRQIAEKIRGKPRFLGQHPGGLLITNDPICRHVALERSGGEKNRIITQIDMHSGIDDLGLIKFDLLGNGSLSVLRDTLQQLNEQGIADPEVHDLEKCYRDAKTRHIIGKGLTRGVFYIESPAQTRLNLKAQAQTFEEITITSSLIRPAGASYCREFVEKHRKKKQGIRDWDYLHPSLEPILSETHGVLAFQEDVTKVCHQIAGLGYKQADRIRKMMNSQHEGAVGSEEWQTVQREFVNGCRRVSGLSEAQASELWKRVSSFAGFSFCKSHSGSYAQLSFQCAFLKAHYPAQFLSAVISNNHGFYHADVYLNEARRWGVRVLPIDINQSKIGYFGKHDWLRPGFQHIKGIAARALENIVRERDNRGEFRNLFDFCRRVDMHRHQVEKLILVGAFDGLGMAQPELLFALDGIDLKHSGAHESLFDRNAPPRSAIRAGEFSLTRRCLNELALLGFMLSGNILDVLDLHPASLNAVPAADLHRHAGRGVKIFGWPITERLHRVSSSGKEMMFLTLEDISGAIDVIFWPGNFARFENTLSRPGPYVVWGKVAEEWDAVYFEAENIQAVEWSPARVDFDAASRRLERSYKDYEYRDKSVFAA